MRIFETLLDFILPRQSLSGQEGQWLTPEEVAAFRGSAVLEDAIALRGKDIRFLDRLLSVKTYADPQVRMAIRRLKYGRIATLAEAFAELIAAAAPNDLPPNAVLCPVPLHWTRQWSRGFNQALLLARHVGRLRSIPVQPLLRRSRSTGHQAWRTLEQRRRSLSRAFRCVAPAPAWVVLLDDVATSGATLDACAETLKRAGALHVEGWVIARG